VKSDCSDTGDISHGSQDQFDLFSDWRPADHIQIWQHQQRGTQVRKKDKRDPDQVLVRSTHYYGRTILSYHVLSCVACIGNSSEEMASKRNRRLLVCLLCIACLPMASSGPQVWDVDRLIRARNPGASFTTTVRPNTTWQTLRSITYNPLLEAGANGTGSVEEASLVRRVKPTKDSDSSSGQNKVSIWLILVTMCGLSLPWTHNHR